MDNVYIIETFDASYPSAPKAIADVVGSPGAVKVWSESHGFTPAAPAANDAVVPWRWYNATSDRYATVREFPVNGEPALTIPDQPRLLKSWPVSVKFEGLYGDRLIGAVDVYTDSTPADIARAAATLLRQAADNLEREAS